LKDPSPKAGNEASDLTFEKAFARLEAILEKMNSSETSLDESLKLFEEADGLITGCSRRLTTAERRVEMLIKNRNGDLTMEGDGKPAMTEFLPPATNGNRT
jgi:exodeoxyribonuclease VII small subunit